MGGLKKKKKSAREKEKWVLDKSFGQWSEMQKS